MTSRDDAYQKPGVSDAHKWAPVFRGFPGDVEVLTEFGWVLFAQLYDAGVNGLDALGGEPLFSSEVDWTVEHIPLKENWGANRSRHQAGYEFSSPNIADFTKLSVGARFPRLVTLSPGHVVRKRVQDGDFQLVRPSFATRFNYHDHLLVHIKRRGVDLAVPRFTDVFTRVHLQSSWGFTVADDFTVVKNLENVYRMMVNRYTPQGVLFGNVNSGSLLQGIEDGTVRALMRNKYPVKVSMGGKQASHKRINDVYPLPEVRDKASGQYMKNPQARVDLECYNFILPAGSSHTLIVRRAGTVIAGEQPHTEWVGFPVVVGDGYDKSQIPADVVSGLYK